MRSIFAVASLVPVLGVAAFTAWAADPRAGDLDPRATDAGPVAAPEAAVADQTAPIAEPTTPLQQPAAPGYATDASPAYVPDAPAAAPGADTPTADPAEPSPDAVEPAFDIAHPTVDPLGEPAPTPDPRGETPAEALPQEGPGFGGVPALNYNSDDGFGVGLIGTFYWYDGVTNPYRLAVTLQIFITSKLVQDHNIQVDWLKAFGLPLRINSRVGYTQSLTQNYCGLGGDVTCDPAVAQAAGEARGLSGDALTAFEGQFYKRRLFSPYGLVNARFMLHEAPKPEHLRIELLAGYRGFYFTPGTWADDDGDGQSDLTPYPGSLFARDYPDGQPGFSSVLQAGIIVDTRDHEPAPTEGVFLEASVRGSSPVWGSAWNWAGGNVTLRGYTALDPGRKLILASRLAGDAVLGDPPIEELARVGGTVDYYAFGGSDMGRGIRVQRFLGKLRIFNQTELRWRFWDFSLFGQRFGLTAVGFGDLGIVGAEVAEPGPLPLNVGVGGGLRFSWNENFVIRFDVAVSPSEPRERQPGIYLVINNPF